MIFPEKAVIADQARTDFRTHARYAPPYRRGARPRSAAAGVFSESGPRRPAGATPRAPARARPPGPRHHGGGAAGRNGHHIARLVLAEPEGVRRRGRRER